MLQWLNKQNVRSYLTDRLTSHIEHDHSAVDLRVVGEQDDLWLFARAVDVEGGGGQGGAVGQRERGGCRRRIHGVLVQVGRLPDHILEKLPQHQHVRNVDVEANLF